MMNTRISKSRTAFAMLCLTACSSTRTPLTLQGRDHRDASDTDGSNLERDASDIDRADSYPIADSGPDAADAPDFADAPDAAPVWHNDDGPPGGNLILIGPIGNHVYAWGGTSRVFHTENGGRNWDEFDFSTWGAPDFLQGIFNEVVDLGPPGTGHALMSTINGFSRNARLRSNLGARDHRRPHGPSDRAHSLWRHALCSDPDGALPSRNGPF